MMIELKAKHKIYKGYIRHNINMFPSDLNRSLDDLFILINLLSKCYKNG